MAKYDESFKLLVVHEYLSGPLGYELLAQKYSVKSNTLLKNWVAVYRKYGAEGLRRKRKHEVYSVQFKLEVLSYMKRTGASVLETALQFGLTNPRMVTSWKKKLLEGGAEALDKPKGRPAMSKKAKKAKKFTRKSRRYSSYKGSVGTVAKNRINRRFKVKECHQKLATDITEFKCADGSKLYLSPIIDLFNGEILSYGISKHPTLDLVFQPLQETLEIIREAKYRTTLHSDQGWHYQHSKWVRALKKHKVFQSMSRKGNCLDNSPMENFFGLMKQEMYYGEPLETFEKLKNRIERYMDYYNNKRIKQKLAGMSPVQYRLHTSQLAA